MKTRLFITFSLLTFFASAQLPGKEAWHWYFDSKCALDFSSGTPVAVPGISGGYFTDGGASMSDPNTGQYLFSCGGQKIYNKNNVLMYNGYGIYDGIWGGGSIIIQKPGSSSIYYVITTDAAKLVSHGVTYSIVDMSLQGGLGAVISKNKLLTSPPTTEKITAVRHCNGVDYWVLTHPANSNAFNAYLLTSTGLDTVPVVSHTGVVHQFLHTNGYSYFEGWGALKASPNGKRLAASIQSDTIPILEFFDFDNSTGIISNPITITSPVKFGPSSANFSPDNSKAYAVFHTDYFAVDTSFIFQYDFSSGVPSSIIASQTLIVKVPLEVTSNANFLGAMQLAPDGKIYVARTNRDTIAAINNPNAFGLACNFQYNSMVLIPPAVCLGGLTTFIDANNAGIQINIPDVQQCNTFTTTTLDAGAGFAGYFWSTGASTQTISINAPGKYWVTATNEYGCTRTDTVNAYLLNPVKSDTLVCDTFHANVVQGGVLAYHWFDGSTNPVRNFTQSGNYYVDINYVSGCAIRDSINVTVVPSPQINIGPDTTFCKGDLTMNATCNTCTYQWSTGETNSGITVKTPGVYSVKVKDANGCVDYDSLIVKPQLSIFNFVMPNIVTPNDDKINDEVDFSKYQLTTFKINIFNRWGQEIFKSEDPNAVWKPTQDDGTYYYTAQYKIDCTVDSQTKTLKGFITVVR